MSSCRATNANRVDGSPELTEEVAAMFRNALKAVYVQDEKMYQVALASGVPKELARLVLPVGRYSRMRASANLRNWLSFLSLRDSPEAQWEIRQFAIAVGALVKQHFPLTWELFQEKKV